MLNWQVTFDPDSVNAAESLMMPAMDGHLLAQKIRSHSKFDGIKIVAVTWIFRNPVVLVVLGAIIFFVARRILK